MRRSGSTTHSLFLSPQHPHSERTKRRQGLSAFLCFLAVLAVSLSPVPGAAADHRRPAPPPAVTEEGLRVLPAVAPVMSCGDVTGLDLRRAARAEVTITSAVVVSENTPNPYCEVRGTIAPANTIVVRLPLEGWTQRYLQTGCGGLCGNASINYGQAADCPVVEDGTVASATTDMGHQGQNDGSWAADNPQAQIDFAYRGVHVTALTAKALITKFYGRSPAYSYFTGCSDGGREALMEAQRFPDDFDGIAAGAPANNMAVQNTYHHAWNVLANKDADGNDILLAGKLPLIHNAVLAACDTLDGLADGVLDDPRACGFDPASLICAAGQDPAACLSAAEAEVVRKLHNGAVDDQGRRLEPEISHEWGSELAWTLFVPEAQGDPVSSEQFALSYLRYLADPNNPRPDFELTDLEFTKQAFWETMQSSGYMSAMDPDLGAFKRSGGKLLLWHGWNDHHISPQSTLAYYDAVRGTMGKHAVNDFARLFMFPGVEHCSGGEGPDSFDVLTPVMAWVESGRAPASIIASKMETADDGAETVSRTRPVYPYPAVARYDGSGSTDDAANFASYTPKREIGPDYKWLGSRLYSSDYQTWCRAEGTELVCGQHRGGRNWLSREAGRH
ncbi:tannase/feruloyl esterase family alpha/beta hydrolase [Arthrobacter sp. zg-Y179]|uniref:tannase/feruloyl esterase family alpha/beta hydrolase n=1 Tax=Arthrobacter sp. zg-Y179 TaxID=2894188 RepID=UPI001E642168|nr:tannase/feruloyl esterase family alpha/beta hydrolase [Arthrobacter sp. zg-Y179]MCC9172966.1 tannase/feruloyl esterase family alpha/beta hydrolase [Arthrobacter sp. zg-Y179]